MEKNALFAPYKRQGTWQEALSVYFFVSTIRRQQDPDRLWLQNYEGFELKDTDLQAYEAWAASASEDEKRFWTSQLRQALQSLRCKTDFLINYFSPKVELWSDRQKSGYFKEKLQAAFEFENYIETYLKQAFDLDIQPFYTPEGQYNQGENNLGIEIKNDTLIRKYGNLYIEYAEKSKPDHPGYTPSGILKKYNNRYFLTGERHEFWIFRKQTLLAVYKEEKALFESGEESPRGILFKKKPTSLGFVYPLKKALADCLSAETMAEELKKGLKQ